MIYLMYKNEKVLEMEGQQNILNEKLLPECFKGNTSKQSEPFLFGLSFFTATFINFVKEEILRTPLTDDEQRIRLSFDTEDNIKFLSKYLNSPTQDYWYLEE